MKFDIKSGKLYLYDGGPKGQVIDATSGKGDCVNNAGCTAQKFTGPIPVGNYYINASEISEPGTVGAVARQFRGDWGSFRVAIHPDSGTRTLGRDGFYLHGGNFRGSAGCVDIGGGVFGNRTTRNVLRLLRSDRDGRIPLRVIAR